MMHPLIYALPLLALPVALGLLLRYLSRRQNRVLVTTESIAALRARIDAVRERSQSEPVLTAMVNLTEHFMRLAGTALEFDQQVRARLHLNLVAMTLAWVEAVLDDWRVDTPHKMTTNRLALGIALLKDYKLDLAQDEFQQVWLDVYANLKAKQLAVMGRVWLLATRGQHQEAAEEEFLLMNLPRAAALEGTSLEFTVS